MSEKFFGDPIDVTKYHKNKGIGFVTWTALLLSTVVITAQFYFVVRGEPLPYLLEYQLAFLGLNGVVVVLTLSRHSRYKNRRVLRSYAMEGEFLVCKEELVGKTVQSKTLWRVRVGSDTLIRVLLDGMDITNAAFLAGRHLPDDAFENEDARSAFLKMCSDRGAEVDDRLEVVRLTQ